MNREGLNQRVANVNWRARLRKCLAALPALTVSMSSLAEGTNSWPSPGDYRIDTDTLTTSTAGPTSVERRQVVDGDSGNVKVTLRDTLAGTKPATQTFPGTGPNKWCVPSAGKVANGPPAKVMALCSDAKAPSGATSSCGLQGVVETWRRLDDRTWERTIKATQSPAADLATSAVGQQAMAAAAGRAGAVAGMPSQKDRDAAMAPVFAALEEAVRSGSAEDKAMAQQQLAMLRGTAAPKGAGGTTVESKERWRRVAEVCPR